MKRYLGYFIIGILILSACKNTGSNTTQQLLLTEGDTPIPNQVTLEWKGAENSGKEIKTQTQQLDISTDLVNEIYILLKDYSQQKKSSYVAFISKKNKKENKFKYRYFKLYPNQKDLDEAKGEEKFYFHIFIDPSNEEIYQVFAVIVPDTPVQLEAVKKWGDKLNSNSTTTTVNKSNQAVILVTCTSSDGLIWVPECGCFGPGTIEVCAPSDDAQQLEPDDGGGGTADCNYEPGGCEEDPTAGDPTGGGSGSTKATYCPDGQVETIDGSCVNGEMPCIGNPLKNPRIAPQTNSGIQGGRFTTNENGTAVRNGGTKDHYGLDIDVDHGEALFSMYDGQVITRGYDKEGWGKWLMVRYFVDGKEIWTVYAHLNTIQIEDNVMFSPGLPLATSGFSGNLKGAIEKGYAIQHLHVEMKENGWKGKDKINPEDYLTTKFDSNGNVIAGTDC